MPIEDRAHRAAASQMTDDQAPRAFRGEQVQGTPGAPFDVQPVEAEAANPVPLAPIARDRISEGGEWQGVVKGGVEAENLRQPRKGLGCGVDSLDRCSVVKRGELLELLELRPDAVVQPRWTGEAAPAVNDAVTDRVGRRLGVGDHASKSGRMSPRRGVRAPSLRTGDHRRLPVHQRVLEAAGACVDHEHPHGGTLVAPGPVADLGHVLEVLADVVVVAVEHRVAVLVEHAAAPGMRRGLRRSASSARW